MEQSQDQRRATVTQELRLKLRADNRKEVMEAVEQTMLYLDLEIESYLASPMGQEHVTRLIQEENDLDQSLNFVSRRTH